MDAKKLDRTFEAAGWGLLCIWWGLSLIPRFLPNGFDAAGTGLILLGVSAARRAKGLPARRFAVVCGILCLIWGGLDLSRSLFHLPYRPPVFAILVMALGVICFGAAILRERKPADGER
jgi:hypothetical protein